jgi:Tfp pilus assembly protein PilF
LRLRPDDPELLAQSAWAWLESGNAQEARRISEQALSRDRSQWLAWAVLARAAGDTGDRPTADDAIRKARDLTPAGARGVLEEMLSGSPPAGGPVRSKAGQ